MSPILMGGKAVKPSSHHTVLSKEEVAAKAAELTQRDRELNAKASWNVDPIGSFQGTSQASLMAMFGDHTLSLEQGIHELAAHLWKFHRLVQKLNDPALHDNPHREDAEARRVRMGFETSGQLAELALLDARCDRVWQAMDADSRASYAGWWNVTPETDRIVGQAFFWHIGMEEWPAVSVGTSWLRALPLYLSDDLRRVGADRFELKRNPDRAPF